MESTGQWRLARFIKNFYTVHIMYYMLDLYPNPNGLTIGCWRSSCSLQPVAKWTGCNGLQPHTRLHATGCERFRSSCTQRGTRKTPVRFGCLLWKAKRPDQTRLLNSKMNGLAPCMVNTSGGSNNNGIKPTLIVSKQGPYRWRTGKHPKQVWHAWFW